MFKDILVSEWAMLSVSSRLNMYLARLLDFVLKISATSSFYTERLLLMYLPMTPYSYSELGTQHLYIPLLQHLLHCTLNLPFTWKYSHFHYILKGKVQFGLQLNITIYSNEKINIKWLNENVLNSTFIELNTCAEQRWVNVMVYSRYIGKENVCMIWENSPL